MGPLQGLRIIELAGIGPTPFCAMLLADLGADVLRIDRLAQVPLGTPVPPEADLTRRSRRSAGLDLTRPGAADAVLRMVERADALIEGFRPGVAERLGVGPEPCMARNPRLVYGRMTGWGQDGPLAHAAGHDANYIALTGALHAIGPGDGAPVPPLNLVGDYGGGALFLALGILSAVFEAGRSGLGQVVDAAMVDGAAALMTPFYGRLAAGVWTDARASNPIDGGAHFYGVYETADGKYVTVAAIEPRFYAELLELIGLDGAALPDQWDSDSWPEMRRRFAEIIGARSRDEWCAALEGTDACFAPVLSMTEAPDHPHMRARGTFVEYDGMVQPAPAPRFSRTPGAIRSPPPSPGAHTGAALRDWGLDDDDLARLSEAGAIADEM